MPRNVAPGNVLLLPNTLQLCNYWLEHIAQNKCLLNVQDSSIGDLERRLSVSESLSQ